MFDRIPIRQEPSNTLFRQEDSIPTIRVTPTPRRSAASGIALIGFLVLTSTAAYLLINPPAMFRSNDEARSAVAAPPPPSGPSPAEAEDLTRHTEGVGVSLVKALEDINRSQIWIDRTIPALDRNDLTVAKTRLQSAAAAVNAARRQLEQAREETEILKNLLLERRNAK